MRRLKSSAATSIADRAPMQSQRQRCRRRSSAPGRACSPPRPRARRAAAPSRPAARRRPPSPVPSPSPRRIGPSTSSGARTETLDPLPAPHADRDRPRRAQRQVAARVADRRAWRAPGRHGPDAACCRARSRSRAGRMRLEVASDSVRRPEHGGDQLDALALAGADQDVAGVEGVAGLDPVHPRHLGSEVVDRFDPARRVEAAQERRAGVGDLREGRDLQQAPVEGRRGRRRSSSCPSRRARSGSRSGCR